MAWTKERKLQLQELEILLQQAVAIDRATGALARLAQIVRLGEALSKSDIETGDPSSPRIPGGASQREACPGCQGIIIGVCLRSTDLDPVQSVALLQREMLALFVGGREALKWLAQDLMAARRVTWPEHPTEIWKHQRIAEIRGKLQEIDSSAALYYGLGGEWDMGPTVEAVTEAEPTRLRECAQ